MQLRVSPQDGLPLYLQIMNQVKFLVASGRLQSGEELPPIRVLAQDLLINPNTVARAYRELEAAGVVSSRRGAGTYVSDKGTPLSREERLRLLRERIDAVLVEANQLRFSVDDVVRIVRERGGQLGAGKASS